MQRKLLMLITAAALLLAVCSCGRKIESDSASEAKGGSFGAQAQAENEGLEASVRITYEPLTEKQMEKKADLIVIGTASGDFSYVNPDAESPSDVYTDFTVNVQQTVKGIAQDSITVRIIGGKNGKITVCSSEKPLEKGQQYFMYLRKVDDGQKTVYYCINGIDGCFKIDGDGTLDFEDRDTQHEVERLYLNAVSAQNKSEGNDESETENNVTDGEVIFTDYACISPQELEQKADLILVGEFTGGKNQVVTDRGGATESVYTDHVMKTLSVIKGEAGAEINVRILGGTVDGKFYVGSGEDPHFEKGGRYLMFLNIQDNAVTANKAECYCLIAGDMYCFAVGSDGMLDFKNVMYEEDNQAIDSLYKSKVDTDALAEKD